MAPPQSLADKKATLDAIVEQIKTQANPGTILVKIQTSDSFDDIKSKINNAITTLNDDRAHLIENALNDATKSIYKHNLSFYKEQIENNIHKIEDVKPLSLVKNGVPLSCVIMMAYPNVNFFIPQIKTFLTTFEGDLQDEIASTTFIIPKGALVTNVMLTSTSTGRHFYLPTSEVQKFAATALYAPVDAAGLTSVSFKPAEYDSISGMAGEIKAVTVSYVSP